MPKRADFGPDHPFTGAEIISEYSDRQAVEDGILVAVANTDRVTRTVWEKLLRWAADKRGPANYWTVILFDAISKDPDRRAAGWARGLMTESVDRRRCQADEIIQLWFDENEWKLYRVAPARHDNPHRVELWLRGNELGGVTLMTPEDN